MSKKSSCDLVSISVRSQSRADVQRMHEWAAEHGFYSFLAFAEEGKEGNCRSRDSHSSHSHADIQIHVLVKFFVSRSWTLDLVARQLIRKCAFLADTLRLEALPVERVDEERVAFDEKVRGVPALNRMRADERWCFTMFELQPLHVFDERVDSAAEPKQFAFLEDVHKHIQSLAATCQCQFMPGVYSVEQLEKQSGAEVFGYKDKTIRTIRAKESKEEGSASESEEEGEEEECYVQVFLKAY